MEFQISFNKLLEENLEQLKCLTTTKAYIAGLFKDFMRPDFNYSGESITILFHYAKQTHNFKIYQNLGDWLLFCETIFPEHLKFASKEYYTVVAQLSYYSCYKMTNKKWIVFEQLADEFIPLTSQTRKIIQNI